MKDFEYLGRTFQEQTKEHSKVAREVYVTEDYSIFKKQEGNREVTPGRVNDLIKSYKTYNDLHQPITVNEHMQVIEGQGRLAALKQLGMPVEYQIVTGLGLTECIALNKNNSNWKLNDYIESYASQGDRSYLFLKYLLTQFPDVSLNVASTALFRTLTFNSRSIKSGNVYISEATLSKAFDHLRCISSIMQIYCKQNKKKSAHSTILYQTLLLCYDYNLDMDRLTDIVYNKLTPKYSWSDVDDCMSVLEDLYNFKLPHNKKVQITLLWQREQWNKKGQDPTIYKKEKQSEQRVSGDIDKWFQRLDAQLNVMNKDIEESYNVKYS